MKRWNDDQPVTYGMLKEVLTEVLTVSFREFEARLDARMDVKLEKLEQNMTELINDVMGITDTCLVKLERQSKRFNKGYERVEDHSVRIDQLEVKLA